MTDLFFDRASAAERPAQSSPISGSAACERALSVAVGPALHKLTDSEREAAIHRAGLLIESSMKEWEDTGCFAARGRAIYAQQCMERLIKGRSPEYVAKIERERGLL